MIYLATKGVNIWINGWMDRRIIDTVVTVLKIIQGLYEFNGYKFNIDHNMYAIFTVCLNRPTFFMYIN